MFSLWFQQSTLFSLPLQELLTHLDRTTTIIMLVDEIMLYNGKDTSQEDFIGISSFLCDCSDLTLVNADEFPTVIPFIMSLYFSYCSQGITATRRPIILYPVDNIEYTTVMRIFEEYYETFGHKVVQCLVNMCLGHARSVEYVLLNLQRGPAMLQLSGLLMLIYDDLASTGIFPMLTSSSIVLLVPVLLDLKVHATNEAVINGLRMIHEDVINGSRVVCEGAYFNYFGKNTGAEAFQPI